VERSSPLLKPWMDEVDDLLVFDAWPLQCQIYDYLSSRKTSLTCDWYQITLLGDRGHVCEQLG